VLVETYRQAPVRPTLEQESESFEFAFDVNVKAPFSHLLLLPKMIAHGSAPS